MLASSLPVLISSISILPPGSSVLAFSSLRMSPCKSAEPFSVESRHFPDGKLTLSSSEAVNTDVIIEKNIDTPNKTTTALSSSIIIPTTSVGA